jgi:prepilin-type processing-associated H-X9-DG protein
MRFHFAMCLCLAAMMGCGKKASSSDVAGTWSINSPVYGVIAFSDAGTYEIEFPGDPRVTKGSYTLTPEELTLRPGEVDNFSMSYKLTKSGDTMSLEPIPPKGFETGTDAAFLKALVMQLRRFSSSQHLDPSAIQSAKDSASQAGAPAPRDEGDCLSQVKQLCLSVQLYAEDYDQVLPQNNWRQELEPYVKNKNLYTCPVVKEKGDENGYAMNADVVGSSLTGLANPATMPLIFDSNSLAPSAVGSIADMPEPPRHPAGNTMGYVDGHVASVR